jgi:two-component system cell cycle sensor histidine kinase/response regulator CckA
MSEDQAETMKPKSTLRIRAEGIAHDLDNTLTAVLANIALARRGEVAREDIGLLLARAEDGILRAKDLTWQLRSLEGPAVLRKKSCSVAAVIADMVGLCRLGPGIACECSLPDRLWTVEADAGQIGQVIQNLLLNAEQAMPGGGTIRVRAENVMLSGQECPEIQGGAFVKLSVEDEGLRECLRKTSTGCSSPFSAPRERAGGWGLPSVFPLWRVTGDTSGWIRERKAGQGSTCTCRLPGDRRLPERGKRGAPSEGRSASLSSTMTN